MWKTKCFFKKIRDTKEIFHVKMRKIKEINGKDLKKAEEIKKRCKNTPKNCTKNVFMKYYSSSDTKLHFWSEIDRIGYINAINNTLYGKADAEDKNIKLIKERIRYGTKQ